VKLSLNGSYPLPCPPKKEEKKGIELEEENLIPNSKHNFIIIQRKNTKED
jgi:hypothetical protein